MRTIQRQIVSALLISKDNHLLMGMKDPAKGGVYSDCWHIPGGGIEEGEDQVIALQREVMEEVGLDISKSKISMVDDKGSGVSIKRLKDGEEVECQMKFYVYKVELSVNAGLTKVVLSDDLIKYAWVDVKDLGLYKLTPPSTILFKRLGWIL
jgi:8-oxo-dGTP pyrophosphatase MutT (NUDIX family)